MLHAVLRAQSKHVESGAWDDKNVQVPYHHVVYLSDFVVHVLHEQTTRLVRGPSYSKNRK